MALKRLKQAMANSVLYIFIATIIFLVASYLLAQCLP